MAKAAAKISIALEAQTASLKQGFAEAKQSIQQLDSNMSMSVAKGMAIFTAGLLAMKAALHGVMSAARSVMSALAGMDEMQKFADRVGMSADALTALGYAAERTGSSQSTLNLSIQKMQNTLGDAAAGTASAAQTFTDLGVSVDDLLRLRPDAQFAAIADAMQGMTSVTDRTRLALDIFGRSGGELINMLSEGSEGLREYHAEAERLGLLMGENRRLAEDAIDAINDMKRAWGGFVAEVATGVAPAFGELSNWFTRLTGQMREWGFWGIRSHKIIGASAAVAARQAAAVETLRREEEEAEAALEKAEEQMQRRVESLSLSLRTPHEIFADSVAELNELVEKGVMSWDIYSRGIRRAVEDLAAIDKAAADFTTPAIGALTRGSAGAFSATQQNMREKADHERRHREAMASRDRIERAIREHSIVLAPVHL